MLDAKACQGAEFAERVFDTTVNWSFWRVFCLSPANPSARNIFGFAEYLSALALLLVVLTTSDFRIRYRLLLTRINRTKVAAVLGFGVGVALLAADVWFENGLPIPHFLNHENNLKGFLGAIFLALVFDLIFVSFIRPPVFRNANAKRFFETNYRLIHEGNNEKLQIMADELTGSLKNIVSCSVAKSRSGQVAKTEIRPGQRYAEHLLSLIADRRFCSIVVEKVPAFSLVLFQEAQSNLGAVRFVYQFSRNIGQEFIRNVGSVFYQEESGYKTGLFGYTHPTTTIVFGCYDFVEKCAAAGASPLDTDYTEISDFSSTQMQGFARASLAFFDSYLKVTKGRSYLHSYAVSRMLGSFEESVGNVFRLDRKDDVWRTSEYGRLVATVGFVKKAIQLAGEHADIPRRFYVKSISDGDIFDDLARLCVRIILSAAHVTAPAATAWTVQHNVVWSEMFGFDTSKAKWIIGFKVRRLLYNEIKQMDDLPNFQGASVLGYCLNIFGLTLMNRQNKIARQFYPLQLLALRWVTTNYGRILDSDPKVAAACLLGSVVYDAGKRRLIKTYSGGLGKEPNREYLDID